MPNDVVLPCNIDGAQISPTLRGFGHGWQGQHNSTNAVFQLVEAVAYDDLNGMFNTIHGTLRTNRNGDFIVCLFDSEDDHPAVLQQVGEE